MSSLITPTQPTLTVPSVARRLGIVTEITTVFLDDVGVSVPAVMLQLGDADAVDDPVGPCRFLESYFPVVGDIVEVLMAGRDQIVLGRLAAEGLAKPEQRIATAIALTDSATFDDSPEVQLQSVTGILRAGRTYRITWFTDIFGTVAGDQFFFRIKEDSISGTLLDFRRWRQHAAVNFPYRTEVEYTAADGAKTFVVSGDRESGTGLGNRDASATSPSYFYIDYIRG